MKILSIVGARPQFVKAGVVSRALRERGLAEVLVHTGQHYDENMSKVFFDELDIPRPDANLEVGSGSHAVQTGEAMKRLEPLCIEHGPDAVIVYGDTNATIAGALTAAKLNVPVAHVEAGLRSFDRTMPEEVNRVLTDHVSRWLFCPTTTSVANLAKEGVTEGVHQVGDVMFDVALRYGSLARERSRILDDLKLPEGEYALVTIHRNFNTDDRSRLSQIADGLTQTGLPIVFPAHPRVRKQLEAFGLMKPLEGSGMIRVIEPVGYLDMVRLEMGAKVIVTDSGGVQKEAFFHGVPCVTVRPSTEWVETVESGWNQLSDADAAELVAAVVGAWPPSDRQDFYGDGHSAEKIAGIIKSEIRSSKSETSKKHE